MRLVTWVSCGFLCSVIALSCGDDPKKSQGNDAGSAGEAGGAGGDTGGGVSKGGCGGSAGTAGSCVRGGAAGTDAGAAGSSARGGTGGAAGDGGSSGDGGGDAGDPEAFFDQLWAAYCTYLFTCKIPNDDYIGERVFMGTETRCAEILKELLGEEPPTQDLLAKIAAGSIRFVPENVDACLAETAGCRWLGQLGTDPACRSVFEGEVPLGEPCERWEDCAGRAYCNHATGCPGVCTALGAPGAACEVDEDCDPGSGYAFCDYSGAEPVCKRLAYGPQAALNDDCTVSLEAATELVQCPSNLWCDPGDGMLPTGTCRSPIADGQPCDSPDDVCVGGDVCLADTSCELPQIGREAGDACDEAASIYCDPFAGLVCDTNECQPPGDGTQGMACDTRDILERVTCNPGLYCAGTVAPTCEPLLEADADCTGSFECASGSCAGTCTALYCDG